MTDSAIKYVGVDGCKAGWIGIGLADDGCPKVEVCEDISDIVACFGDACVILVDIPIGLLGDMRPRGRECDEEARKKLGGKRQGVVFSAPIRPLVNEAVKNRLNWNQTNERSKERHGGVGITQQAYSIIPRIAEVDEALSPPNDGSLSKVRESHPEVCFWALNEQRSMSHNKRTREGREERIDVLRRCAQDVDGIDVDAIFKKARDKYTKGQVADDDILDAIALAITARIVSQNPERLGTLPENPPTDSKGLPMEMVYALPNDEGTPC